MRYRLLPILLALSWPGAPAPRAEITLDGTVGLFSGPVSGPDFDLPETFATTVGANRFYSFGIFNVSSSERAFFVQNDAAVIDNVISRVTGGTPSTINGGVFSSIGSADFYFINPSGVVIGESGFFSVPAALHVSTADVVSLGTDGRFDASNPASSTLTTSPPSAFGFLGSNPAPIEVAGSFLRVDPGNTLSLVGGDIDIHDGPSGLAVLDASSGRINLASVASPGQALLGPTGPVDVSGFATLGTVSLRDADLLADEAGSAGAGAVYIRGGRLTMDGVVGVIIGATTTNGDGGTIDIEVPGAAILKGNSTISADSTGVGDGPSIRLHAGSLDMTDTNVVSSADSTGHGGDIEVVTGELRMDNADFTAETLGAARGGDISITATDMRLSNGSNVEAGGNADGDTGDIVIATGPLTLEGGSTIDTFIFFDSSGTALESFGKAGDIDITATGTVRVAGALPSGAFSKIIASADSTQDGGKLAIRAPEIDLDGGFIGTSNQGSGDAGSLAIDTQRLLMRNAGFMSTGNVGSGNGGLLAVHASESVLLTGLHTAIDSGTDESGAGGTITVNTPLLSLEDRSRIKAVSKGAGRAGDIQIQVGSMRIAGDAEVEADARGAGQGGTISINASGDLSISGGPSSQDGIFADAFADGAGGSILLAADRLILGQDARIEASSFAGGDAGNILIDAGTVLASDGALISTSTFDAGNAGSVTLRSGKLTLDGCVQNCSAIESTTRGSGHAGSVVLEIGSASVTDGAFVASSTFAGGDAGTITILANTLRLEGVDTQFTEPAEIISRASSASSGNAGQVVVVADTLTLKKEGRIRTNTAATGNAGTIAVTARMLNLESGGTIVSESTGTGRAGDIRLSGDTIALDASTISTSALTSDGGNIKLDFDTYVLLRDSTISARVSSGLGSGGNIDIDPDFVILSSSSLIANAFGGPGGNISILAGHFFASPDSVLSASSAQSIDGTVVIDSPDTDVTGGVTVLPASFLDAIALLEARCGARAPGKAGSTLVEAGRGGVPVDPGGYLPSFMLGPDGGEFTAAPGDQAGGFITSPAMRAALSNAIGDGCTG